MSIHSCVVMPHLKDSLSTTDSGKYGRMFATLPPLAADEEYLLKLGREGSLMDVDAAYDNRQESTDNPRIAAGFPIFGQFIAHDITADRSLLLHHARLEELRNFRTPRLDLECLYGAGPSGDPHLYDMEDFDKFLIGINDIGALEPPMLRSTAASPSSRPSTWAGSTRGSTQPITVMPKVVASGRFGVNRCSAKTAFRCPPGVSGTITGAGAHVHHNTASSDLAPGSMAATAPESKPAVLGARRDHVMSSVPSVPSMPSMPSMPAGSRTALTLRAGTWRDDAVPRSLGLGRPNCRPWPVVSRHGPSRAGLLRCLTS